MKWKYKTSAKIKITKDSLVIFKENTCMEHAIMAMLIAIGVQINV